MIADPQTIYIVTGDCGSYYCSVFHPLGAYTDREAAEAVVAGAQPVTYEDEEYGTMQVAPSRVLALPLGTVALNADTRFGCH